MEIPVYGLDGSVNEKINFESEVSNETFNSGLVHEITTMQLAGLRSGNASTKTRGEVSGGGKKPYRQKGTGRARQGSTRAPQWRGGAIIFGPRPRNYSYREPSKKVLSALREALLVRVSEGQLSIVPTFEPDTHKTKDFVSLLSRFNVEPGYRNILLVSETFSYEAILGARNVPGISMLSPQQVTPLDVVLSDTVLVTSDSTQWIEQFLKGSV
ncbi:MAG: 50S ribosomal protein L4 [Leptospirillum sp. Group IV 'UBA BS']|nr:MAG: 50S ribosomal protein L4 [Leptospirillum sp. Group IV 'UBA BS']